MRGGFTLGGGVVVRPAPAVDGGVENNSMPRFTTDASLRRGVLGTSIGRSGPEKHDGGLGDAARLDLGGPSSWSRMSSRSLGEDRLADGIEAF